MSASDPLNLKRNLLFLFERGQFTSVVEQATKLSKKNPQDPHLWNLLGAAYAKLGDHESAKVAFQRVIGLSPLHIDANFNLAKVLTLINQKSDAIKVYKKVLKIDPTHFKSSYNLAILLREEGDTSKALSALYKTIKIKPDLAEAYNSLGSLLAELKQSVKSVSALQRAISLKPNYAEAFYNLGQAFQDQGNFTEAIEAYNKSLTIKPDYAEAHNNKGIALQEQGKLITNGNEITLGGDDLSTASAGDITVANRGDLSSTGITSPLLTVQSIGGGGGFTTTYANALMQEPISLGDLNSRNTIAGDLTITNRGNLISTGRASTGLIAQSIGGGGGNVRRLGQQQLANNLVLGAKGLVNGSGGSISLRNAGALIQTEGDYALAAPSKITRRRPDVTRPLAKNKTPPQT